MQQQLEEAIKSDMATISTMKWGTVSGKEFYGRMFGIPLMLSFVFLAVNVLVRFILMGLGLCSFTLTVKLILGMWVVSFVLSLFLGMMLGNLLLISQLIKGRLKTAPLIRKTIMNFVWVFFGLYIVIYALTTLFVYMGEDDPSRLPAFAIGICMILTQGLALLFPMGISSIFLEIELGRLGLGAFFNIISEWVSKSKNQNQPIS